MPLCGSSRCGCALVSVPAVSGAINGALPTIDVAGNGTPVSPWNLTLNDNWAAEVAALGVKGYAAVTSNQTTITTITDVTSATVTFTAVAGRRYRVTGQTLPQSTVANDSVALSITTGANTVVARQDTGALSSANVPAGLSASVNVAPSAGSTTYKLRMARQSGSGNVTNNAAATYPTFILVEDIGPA